MLNGLGKMVGGVLGDTVEIIKMGAEEIVDLPGSIIDGFNEGLMITPEGQEPAQVQQVQPQQQQAPVNEMTMDQKIEALTPQQRAEMLAAIMNVEAQDTEPVAAEPAKPFQKTA